MAKITFIKKTSDSKCLLFNIYKNIDLKNFSFFFDVSILTEIYNIFEIFFLNLRSIINQVLSIKNFLTFSKYLLSRSII